MVVRGSTYGLEVKVTRKQQEWLDEVHGSSEMDAKTARRARIIELLGRGWPQWRVAEATGAGIATVGRVRRRFLETGLEEAVFGYVAPGKPRLLLESDEANLFVSIEPRAGRHFTKVTRTRHGTEFAQMLREIARRYPSAIKIHLVVDNLSTHSLKVVKDALGEEDGEALWSRFDVHYAPKHGSWLNQAEIEIGCISRECLGRLRFKEVGPLRKHVRAWVRSANRERRKINWKFRKADARKKFGYGRPASCR